ncbi:hypothetical protein LIA77_09031 [Sarocladium implicatum]|nr:hypothetical protein LIA77_09031 [Sarocladium implicatum]
MGLKDLFKKKSDDAASHPFYQPILQPGYFGAFPRTFSLYFLGPGQKINAFLFAENRDGQIWPLNAITVHQGMVNVQAVLHSGPSRDTPPLALAGLEKLFRSTTVIALPAYDSHDGGAAVNQIVRLKDSSGIKFEKWLFSVPVGPQGRIETFEWRSSDSIRAGPDRPLERRLLRLSTTETLGREDVVARWTDEAVPENESKLGTFHFENMEALNEMGAFGTLAAVMSLLRIVQATSEAKVAADGMLRAAGKLAGAGIGFAG